MIQYKITVLTSNVHIVKVCFTESNSAKPNHFWILLRNKTQLKVVKKKKKIYSKTQNEKLLWN